MSAKVSTAQVKKPLPPAKGHGSVSCSCEHPGGGRQFLAVGQERAIALVCFRDTRGERFRAGKAEVAF